MITVVGSRGFIGGHLIRRLEALGIEHQGRDRGELLREGDLGCVVHCAGVTHDFRTRPLDTVDAHVGTVVELLRDARLESLVYLSSTRLYRAAGRAAEDDELELDPSDPDHLYDLSKALGEATALSADVPVLVLRLSNVFGVDPASRGFLAAVIREALETGRVELRSGLDSTRNFVGVDDVVGAVLALVERGAHGVFNVAGARAVSHREITGSLAALTGCEIAVAAGAPTHAAPDISIDRLSAAIGYAPADLIDALPGLVDGYRRALAATADG